MSIPRQLSRGRPVDRELGHPPLWLRHQNLLNDGIASEDLLPVENNDGDGERGEQVVLPRLRLRPRRPVHLEVVLGRDQDATELGPAAAMRSSGGSASSTRRPDCPPHPEVYA